MEHMFYSLMMAVILTATRIVTANETTLPAGETTLNIAGDQEVTALFVESNNTDESSNRHLVAFSFARKPWVWSPLSNQLPTNLMAQILPPEAVEISAMTCTSSSCATTLVALPEGHSYLMKTYTATAGGITNEQWAARFLITATFGPSQTGIEELAASLGPTSTFDDISAVQGKLSQWINAQTELPSTSHRAHYRRRANPRVKNDAREQTQGPIRPPCEEGARWHTHALIDMDVGTPVRVEYDSVTDISKVFVKEKFRTEVQGRNLSHLNGILCVVREGVGAAIIFADPQNADACTIPFPNGNPPLWFSTDTVTNFATVMGEAAEIYQLSNAEVSLAHIGTPELNRGAFYIQAMHAPCPFTVATSRFQGRFMKYEVSPGTGTYTFFQMDNRIKLVENTPESPVTGEGDDDDFSGERCITAPKSSFNRGSCRKSKTCAARAASSTYLPVSLTLSSTTQRQFFTVDTKYVYTVRMLRLQGAAGVSPCHTDYDVTSRWWLKDRSASCPSDTVTVRDPITSATLSAAITSSTDTSNPHVHDISIAAGDNCDMTATAPDHVDGVGMTITVNNQCWQHVHADEFNVVDATHWVNKHPGGKAAIQKFANPALCSTTNCPVSATTVLQFPAAHDMLQWDQNSQWLPVLGRLDDPNIMFDRLPESLQTPALAAAFNATVPQSGPQNTLSCGSPNEVANDPSKDHMYNLGQAGYFGNLGNFQATRHEHDSAVWTNVVLTAEDQLRQRVAWALNQIIVVSEVGLFGVSQYRTEPFAHFYDIFVRHAFGNYRDILREVSYSPMMGSYLSYVRNRPFAVVGAAPDENYAREIMQLFSIGLWQLNEDGSRRTDAQGRPLTTYGINDIESLARVWTGFMVQGFRPNVDLLENTWNSIDPMWIEPTYRDRLPKKDLYGGYLGDSYYPLCTDLPAQHFLRAGATYRYLGDSPVSEETTEGNGDVENIAKRLSIGATHPLGTVLCGSIKSQGKCSFPIEVTLSATVTCGDAGGAADAGNLCHVEHVRTIKVTRTVHGVETFAFYEYIRPPCVDLTFFGSGKRIQFARDEERWMCADPATAAAGALCRLDTEMSCERACNFYHEHVSFTKGQAICQANTNTIAREMCDTTNGRINTNTPQCGDQHMRNSFFRYPYAGWTNVDCTLQVSVAEYDGSIALISDSGTEKKMMLRSSRFTVAWESNSWPTIESCPVNDGCTVDRPARSCICPTVFTMSPVFTDLQRLPTSQEELLSRLKIGSMPPDAFSDRYYEKTVAIGGAPNGVKIWLESGQTTLTQEAIFEITVPPGAGHPTRTVFLRNKESYVKIISNDMDGEGFVFRNPPRFMSLSDPSVRDAAYETEALLDHLFFHESTAPFIAKHLIQKFTTSNPSPRYIKAVARAFKNGAYDGQVYSGKYGDLRATVTAVLLEEEGFSSVMEAAPFAGKFREPILQIIHTMRAMGQTPRFDQELQMQNLQPITGQYPYNSPTVFNFFDPAHQPYGPLGESGLVAPEAELATPPKIINFLNGMLSLFSNKGLTSCNSGFGVSTAQQSNAIDYIRDCSDGRQEPMTDSTLSYLAAAGDDAMGATVDNLNLLLTGGRLNSASRNAIVNASSNHADPLKAAQVLVTASPEFSTTAENQQSDSAQRSEPPKPEASGREYKAVVVLTMKGGADSFGSFVPTQCPPENDLYERWAAFRGGLAMNKSVFLPINVANQPCTQFGLHPRMPFLQQRYLHGDATMIANMGNLVEPVTAPEIGKGKGLPEQLFSHNIQLLQAQTVHSGVANTHGHGVFGRMLEQLRKQNIPAVNFNPGHNNPTIFNGRVAPLTATWKGYAGRGQFGSTLETMSGRPSESLFAQTFNERQANAIQMADAVAEVLLNESYQPTADFDVGDDVQRQFKIVASVIRAREEEAVRAERHFFFVDMDGWDTHDDNTDNEPLLQRVNDALEAFHSDMVAQGLWENIAVVGTSEFGRTLGRNAGGRLGTDHAWGGNYWMLGGSVRGGDVKGAYPERMDESDLQLMSRGRFVPTTPWESLWHGVGQWMGIDDASMHSIFPNMANFPQQGTGSMFTQRDLFKAKYECRQVPNAERVEENCVVTCRPEHALNSDGSQCCPIVDGAMSYDTSCGVASCEHLYTLNTDGSRCCREIPWAENYSSETCLPLACKQPDATLNIDGSLCCASRTGVETYDTDCRPRTCKPRHNFASPADRSHCCPEVIGAESYDEICRVLTCTDAQHAVNVDGSQCCRQVNKAAGGYDATTCMPLSCSEGWNLNLDGSACVVLPVTKESHPVKVGGTGTTTSDTPAVIGAICAVVGVVLLIGLCVGLLVRNKSMRAADEDASKRGMTTTHSQEQSSRGETQTHTTYDVDGVESDILGVLDVLGPNNNTTTAARAIGGLTTSARPPPPPPAAAHSMMKISSRFDAANGSYFHPSSPKYQVQLPQTPNSDNNSDLLGIERWDESVLDDCGDDPGTTDSTLDCASSRIFDML